MLSQSSLKFRLALLISLLALASALALSQLVSHFSRQQIVRDQHALLDNVARDMAARLAQDMNTRGQEIGFLATLDTLRDPRTSMARRQAILEGVQKAYPFYAWIGMTDTEGNIVAGTGGVLLGRSVAQRDWFLQGRQGPYFGDAHDAFLLAKLLPQPKWDDLPLRLVDISTPVFAADGKLLGVLCGHLSLDWAFEARHRMLDQLSREGLDVIVVNKDAKVLMGTPQLPSLKVDLSGLSVIKAAAAGASSSSVEVWPDGQRYLTAAVRESGFASYPGMGWTVVARKSETLAFASARALGWMILGVGVVTALVFGVVLWWILRRQLKPLEDISAAAQRIRNEDLTATIPQLEGRGELALFARSLTDLVGSLQGKNAELKLASRVFEESGQGIIVSDAHNCILSVNRAFTRITGYTVDDVLGRTPALLKSGRQGPEFYQAMWSAIQTQGRWQGEVWNRTQTGEVFPEWLTINTLLDETGAVSHYIGIFDDISEKKDYEKRLVHLANYDVLTNLPNRHLLQRQLELALAQLARLSGSAATLALLFVDLDKFKHINDTLGHPVGDEVLKDVAARFRMHVGAELILARWGGDEFVVAMPGATAQQASVLAKVLIDSLQAPFMIGAAHYHLGMSVGVAMYPAHGLTVDSLLRCADAAMYQAKREGANLCRFYDRAMNASVEQFMKIDNALRDTLAQGGAGLSLAFQPQFSPDGKQLLSAEVLVRWTHPELGALSPAQFIPVAEDSGQILPLGDWIFKEAVRSHAALTQAGCAVPLAINCSAHQLRMDKLSTTLQALCQQYGVRPSDLMIEVTESAIMSDEVKALQTLMALKALGCRISIDDFGTGYACLSYIQKIHPAEIKIDQSFVATLLTDPNSRSIVEFTVGLAQSMGIEVVAEGVETEAQRQALQSIGPVKMQGFLLGRPGSLAQLQTLLQI